MSTVLSIRVSKQTRARIDRAAKRLGTTASELARRAFDRFLAEAATTDTRTMYDRVKDCIGTGTSALTDLGTNSKHYLRESFRKIRQEQLRK